MAKETFDRGGNRKGGEGCERKGQGGSTHGIRTHPGQGRRSVGSMPTHKKKSGASDGWPLEAPVDAPDAPRPFGLDAALLAAALLKHFQRIKKRSRGPEGEGSGFDASAVTVRPFRSALVRLIVEGRLDAHGFVGGRQACDPVGFAARRD